LEDPDTSASIIVALAHSGAAVAGPQGSVAHWTTSDSAGGARAQMTTPAGEAAIDDDRPAVT
jgi:hypothetical protein